MSKVRTLSYALNHAIQENFCPGESKRSAKFQLQGETDNKIYSYAHKDGLHSTAKDFAIHPPNGIFRAYCTSQRNFPPKLHR